MTARVMKALLGGAETFGDVLRALGVKRTRGNTGEWRAVDRAMQKLRMAGHIRYVSKKWVVLIREGGIERE